MDSYIRILVDKELKENVKKYAKSMGIDMSNLLRMLIIKEMGANK